MYKDVFALRLRARRKELGESQISVSAETKINQSNISKFESGNLEPNLETLGKLTNYYQVSADWLIGNIYNGKEGDLVKAAILEFYEEAIATIKRADYQASNREELINMILTNLEKDKDKLLERYKEK